MEDYKSGGNEENPQRVEQVIGITSEKLLFGLFSLYFRLGSFFTPLFYSHIGYDEKLLAV